MKTNNALIYKKIRKNFPAQFRRNRITIPAKILPLDRQNTLSKQTEIQKFSTNFSSSPAGLSRNLKTSNFPNLPGQLPQWATKISRSILQSTPDQRERAKYRICIDITYAKSVAGDIPTCEKSLQLRQPRTKRVEASTRKNGVALGFNGQLSETYPPLVTARCIQRDFPRSAARRLERAHLLS